MARRFIIFVGRGQKVDIINFSFFYVVDRMNLNIFFVLDTHLSHQKQTVIFHTLLCFHNIFFEGPGSKKIFSFVFFQKNQITHTTQNQVKKSFQN